MSSTGPPVVMHGRGWWHTAAAAAGDLLGVAAIVLSVPLVILAIGTPLALVVRALLWVLGMQ